MANRTNSFRPSVTPLEGRALMSTAFLDRGIIEVHGTEGRDVIQVRYDGANYVVKSLEDGTFVDLLTVPANRSYDGVRIHAGGGNDDVRNYTRLASMIEGGAGDDLIRGGSHVDELYGDNADGVETPQDGNDSVMGMAGTDRVYGGGGNDYVDGDGHVADTGGDHDIVYGGSGNDTVYGGFGNDYVFGDFDGAIDGGNDFLSGGAGNDFMHGGPGGDQMLGWGGYDQMHGGSGNDAMDGGNEGDTLDGGEGDDIMTGGAGNDTLRGGAGDDIMGAQIRYTGTRRDSNFYEDTYFNYAVLDDAGNDTLWGGEGNDTMRGGTGNDKLNGQGGNDILGADVVKTFERKQRDGKQTSWSYKALGEDGDDLLEGDYGDDNLKGGNGNDSLYGGWGNDVLGARRVEIGYKNGFYTYEDAGDNGDDVMSGGEDDDAIHGGDGKDRLYGGDGNDTFTTGHGERKEYGDVAQGPDHHIDYVDGGAGINSARGSILDEYHNVTWRSL